MGFPADRAGGARKKFFSLNVVELWLHAWCLPCLQDAMENSTLKLMFVYPLFALPTKLHGEHCAQAYDCFPFELLCEFALSPPIPSAGTIGGVLPAMLLCCVQPPCFQVAVQQQKLDTCFSSSKTCLTQAGYSQAVVYSSRLVLPGLLFYSVLLHSLCVTLLAHDQRSCCIRRWSALGLCSSPWSQVTCAHMKPGCCAKK